jgi:hypothetical protein
VPSLLQRIFDKPADIKLQSGEQEAGAVTGKSTISQAPVASSVIVIVKLPLEIRLPENVVADP